MRGILFAEIDGIKFFKCDTFWSKSEKIRNAKIYSSLNHDNIQEFERLLKPVIPSYHLKEDDLELIEDSIKKYKDRIIKLNGSILGYYLLDDNMLENAYRIKEGISIDDLGKPNYLWVVKINESNIEKSKKVESNKSLLINFETSVFVTYIDYRNINRENVIDDILKQKSEN